MRHYLGLLGIFKNESMVLDEWLRHYLWQGVDHVWLINNDSDDDYLSVLEPYIRNGYVTLYDEPGKYMQGTHYTVSFRKFKGECEWLLVCDVDEYLFGVDQRLCRYLRSVDSSVTAINSHWRLFGSSGHDLQPESIREGFTLRHKDIHACSKGIYRADNITWINAHNCDFDCPSNEIVDDERLHLNHYQVMSREYFRKVKIPRGDVAADHLNALRTMEYFDRREDPSFGFNTTVDDTLALLVREGYKNVDF